MNACECLRCGRKWNSRSEFPGECPTCGSVVWDVPPGEWSPYRRGTVSVKKEGT